MRPLSREQLPLSGPGVEHRHAEALARIDRILWEHPHMSERVLQDLAADVSANTGRAGMRADSVLRVAIVKVLGGVSNAELSFRLEGLNCRNDAVHVIGLAHDTEREHENRIAGIYAVQTGVSAPGSASRSTTNTCTTDRGAHNSLFRMFLAPANWLEKFSFTGTGMFFEVPPSSCIAIPEIGSMSWPSMTLFSAVRARSFPATLMWTWALQTGAKTGTDPWAIRKNGDSLRLTLNRAWLAACGRRTWGP
jgi:hypothetical protein